VRDGEPRLHGGQRIRFVAKPSIPIGGRTAAALWRCVDAHQQTARGPRDAGGAGNRSHLQKLYPKQFDPRTPFAPRKCGNRQQLQAGVAPRKSWRLGTSLSTFDQVRRKYFLYK